MIKKILKGLYWLILLILIIVIALLGYGLGTNHGLQQLLGIGQKYAPGTLTWSVAEGSLLSPLNLENISYEQKDGLIVKLGSAQLQWSPKQLLSKSLQIVKLHTSDLELHLPKPTETPAPKAPAEPVVLPDIRLPIGIDLQDIDLSNIRIFPFGATQAILIDRVALSGGAEGETLQVLQFDLKSPEAQVTVNGLIHPVDDYAMDIALSWRYAHTDFGNFNGTGTIKGDLETLELEHSVQGPVELSLATQLQTPLEEPLWDASLQASSGNLGQFVPTLEGTPLNLDLTSKGSLNDFVALADLDTDLKETGPLNLTLDTLGNTKQITINNLLVQLLSRPGTISLSGDVDIIKQSVDLNGAWESLAWPLVGLPAVETPKGELTLKGGADDFIANLSALLQSDQFGRINTQLAASGNQESVQLSQLQIASPDSDITLDATAHYDIKDQRFAARGNWNKLAWPLQGEPTVTSPSGKFQADGLVSDYTFSLEANVQGRDIPSSNWELAGNGDEKHLEQFEVNGNLLDGQLAIGGAAAWAPKPEWDIALQGHELNPGVKWTEVPGSLTFNVTSKGFLDDNGPQLEAIIESLEGQIKQQKLSGQGKLLLAGKELSVDRLDLNSGDTKLSADGLIGEKWDLDWVVSSPDLSNLVSEIKGSLKANGKLSGSAEAPHASASLTLSDFDTAGTKIESLHGKIDVDILGKNKSTLLLTGKQLHASGQQWDKLKLDANGFPEQHALNLTLEGPLANISTAIEGSIKNEEWVGFLSDLKALKTEFGDWMLVEKAAIKASATNASVDPICLDSKPSKICLSGGWDAKKGSSGFVELHNIRPERFSQYIPEGIVIDTALNGTIDGKVDAKGNPKADVSLILEPGELKLQADTDPISVVIGKSTINTQLVNDIAKSTVHLDLGEIGDVSSTMKVLALSKSPTLDGNVDINLSDLSIISSFAPQLQEINGSLTSKLALKGSPNAPAMTGHISLLDFAAEVPEYALEIKDTHFVAKSSTDGLLQLDGKSHSGEGVLNISGSLNPKTQALELNIIGEDYQLANSDQIKALISPKLDINMNSEGMSVKGEVAIPSAYINANGGSDEIKTVSSSSDVVIIEDENYVEQEKPASKLNLEVRVILSEDVKVEAGDFRGSLSGNLLVEQSPELAPRGTGTIEVKNGDYVIYGQQLNMQRGRILFGGGPVDNPQLDMDVARTVELYDVVAGAKIRGTAQAPQLQLYSEPSMPDASILSYILLGQPPGTKGGSYTLGKYLTPDLYVSYGIGLFDAINTFNMRYKLTDTFAIQAASSTASSADLIYTIEK